jgi:hypothetical protein
MTKEEKIARRDELRQILGPKSPPLTESDHKLAMWRFMWEELSYELFDLVDTVLVANGKPGMTFKKMDESGLKRLKRDALRAAERIHKAANLEDDEKDFAELYVGERFNNYIRSEIENSEIHVGDCTAVACSCMRCVAEAAYKLPSTAPAGKAKGWELYKEYLDLYTELKKGE